MPIPSLARSVKRLDHRLGRWLGRRRVLFDIRTPMNLAVLRPLLEALIPDSRITCYLTSEDTREPRWLEAAPGVVVSPRRAAGTRFDLYVNADPWAATRLYRCARRLNFFHGVAGKYDLDSPNRLPIAFGRYDRIAFINEDRLRRYTASGVISQEKAALIGYPKIDQLALGDLDGAAIRRQLGLAPGRPTAIFAPTFSPASALHVAGEGIVRTLLDADWNVIVKLHDRSMVPSERYTAGVDWCARFRAFAPPDRYVFGREGDATPLLAAADVMVTDHSTIGFEFLLMDRPLIVFDAPELTRTARINAEKVALLRSAARVVRDVAELREAAADALCDPVALSGARQRVAAQMFYDPGRATARAVRLVYELLDLPMQAKAVGVVAPAAARQGNHVASGA